MTRPPDPTSSPAPGATRLQARIGTRRAQRYLDQLARHATAVAEHQHAGHAGFGHTAPQVQVAQAGPTCVLTFAGLGSCTLTAATEQLTAVIDAADTAASQRMAELVGADLRRFSQRDPLTIEWWHA